ncbi:hypothetical protein ACFE04_018688 [Oxalis oulophora]
MSNFSLSKVQSRKLLQFKVETGATKKESLQALKTSGWDFEEAIRYFYSKQQPQNETETDTRILEELYERYKDQYQDMILVDHGITLLCDDIQVDPQDIVMLVVSWHMKAATMCEFTKEEFINGLKDMEIDSLEKFCERVPFIRAELKDEEKFGEIYKFAFGWAKEKGQKFLGFDTAIGMWQLLFAENRWPLVDQWCEFLQAHHNKSITQDTWCQLLLFVRTVDAQLSNYDPEGSWPYLIDEFVDYLTENKIIIINGQLNDLKLN